MGKQAMWAKLGVAAGIVASMGLAGCGVATSPLSATRATTSAVAGELEPQPAGWVDAVELPTEVDAAAESRATVKYSQRWVLGKSFADYKVGKKKTTEAAAWVLLQGTDPTTSRIRLWLVPDTYTGYWQTKAKLPCGHYTVVHFAKPRYDQPYWRSCTHTFNMTANKSEFDDLGKHWVSTGTKACVAPQPGK